MKVIMPMAGKGLRFRKAGYDIPKWHINILDKHLAEWALSSIEDKVESIIFIVNEEDASHIDVKSALSDIAKGQRFEFVITPPTRGQAETTLKATPHMKDKDNFIILNCDNIVKVTMSHLIKEGYDGVIPCFSVKGKSHNYRKSKSYVLPDKNGMVLRTAEKKVLSDYATAGMYYFKRWGDYENAYEKMINKKDMKKDEFYVAPVYNYLKNARIKMVLAKYFFDLGTPACFERFVRDKWKNFSKEYPFDPLGADYTKV